MSLGGSLEEPVLSGNTVWGGGSAAPDPATAATVQTCLPAG